MEVADFDAWRERYDTMTYQEMKDFYDRVEAEHPLQQAYNANAFVGFLDHAIGILGPVTVLEVGGWKGELANEMLVAPGIIMWHNLEICNSAIRKTIAMPYGPIYQASMPNTFVWDIALPKAGVLVASHFIEHIRQRELAALVGNLPDTIQFAGLQSPIPESCYTVDWTGYHGSHILEIGWKQASDLLLRHRFTEISALRDGDFRAFWRAA